ncbi:MAG: hypothetical protein K1X78_12245 [Verrucomicrobiaceae bacterium]|nr:hypothetical protein [Verrucomicrobiaceae bacterium]
MVRPPAVLTPENLRIHVVHYSPFVERRAHMELVLREHGFDGFPVDWMLQHDREALLDEWSRGEWGDPGVIAASSVSLILKHIEVWRLVAREPERMHLVLEDDILVKPGLIADLECCLTQLPQDWEMLFVGEGCGLHVPWWRRRPGRRVYFRGWKPWFRAGGGTSRCTEAYFIEPGLAARLSASRFARPPFTCPIDWLLCEAGREMHIRSYWAEPPLITQGAFESWTKNPALNPQVKT